MSTLSKLKRIIFIPLKDNNPSCLPFCLGGLSASIRHYPAARDYEVCDCSPSAVMNNYLDTHPLLSKTSQRGPIQKG